MVKGMADSEYTRRHGLVCKYNKAKGDICNFHRI
jgi:hypothetical protein